MRGRNCGSFRTQDNNYERFALDDLVDANPTGYKVFFQLSVIANKTAGIILQSVLDEDTNYQISMINIVDDWW